MEVKICGLRSPLEAEYLNAAGADYAGFVFFPPSKRNVSLEQAKEIMKCLKPDIRKVAVLVSPDVSMIEALQAAPFDILQIHKVLTKEVLEAARCPVWYAVNVSDPEALQEKVSFLEELPYALQQKVTGIVVDGAGYGSGKTFEWKKTGRRWRESTIFHNRKFILAGGLNAANVQEGIKLFAPDVVDVSSGVEGVSGKDRDKINAFIGKVREHE